MDIKKSVIAKIYDPENNKLISDINIEVILVNPKNPNEKPQYRVAGLIEKYDDVTAWISDKNLILEFTPELRGFALFSISDVTGWFTKYKIFLQDSIWMNLTWFESI